MTKPQLLTAYLNVAYFDHQTHGIYVAAQYYFSEKPSQLTLPQAALLAGLVQDPSKFDPVANPDAARARRNVVLQAMATHGYISRAAAARAGRAPLGLHPSPIPLGGGCISPVQADAAYFCDYVLAVMKHDPQYAKAYNELTTVGGLKIYTTMNPKDQLAATRAVKFVLPPNNGYYNPNRDVDTQVMVQPGTGYLRAIAVNQPYGFGPGQTSIDYAAPTPYDGGVGVQTGSSSKIFTLITALKQGLPFGFSLKEKDGGFYGPYYGCHGQYIPAVQFHNAEGAGENGTIPLYYGTTASINGFYAALEAKVGLCNVVKTAISMGMTWADGTSLLHRDNGQPSADEIPSFTLGAVYVSPMSMAAAYASVDSRGIYCHPIAILKIVDASGKSLPVESAGCHRVMPQAVADAANYVLQGVLTGGTAAGRGIGRPAAAKTGTANGGYYAAFAGYTPTLVAYTSVFNPTDPTGAGAMVNCPNSDYREFPGGGLTCPGQMFGDNAPGATWEYAFTYAALGRPLSFAPPASFYFSMGPGTAPKLPPKKHKPGKGGGGGGGGNGGGGGGGGNGGGHGHP
jgi:membrane peptidoglycan carboxypeptidase